FTPLFVSPCNPRTEVDLQRGSDDLGGGLFSIFSFLFESFPFLFITHQERIFTCRVGLRTVLLLEAHCIASRYFERREFQFSEELLRKDIKSARPCQGLDAPWRLCIDVNELATIVTLAGADDDTSNDARLRIAACRIQMGLCHQRDFL